MSMGTEHSFTPVIREILRKSFGECADAIFHESLLVQYINEKTRSADRGSKARGSFANLYSLYVIVEDYLSHGFHEARSGKYVDYEGARYTDLFRRQRELPFGAKLQNHSLNNRTNSEFRKYFPTSDILPIIRNQESNRYWINEGLINITVGGLEYNIAETVVEIIDEYVRVKQQSFDRFIEACQQMQSIGTTGSDEIKAFIQSLLAPNVDARLFEIVSYSVLKYYYVGQSIFWGFDIGSIEEDNLKLYKTGRTNANDGGIDFVMKPLGRFFQVTETLDFKKYFLDLDKVERYPVTFVVKSVERTEDITARLRSGAMKMYPVKSMVEKYMACVEEIINIPKLLECFEKVVASGLLRDVLAEIILQSKVEFNYSEEEED